MIQTSFAEKFGLHINKTNIDAQKIDNNRLKMFRIVIASILVYDTDKKSRFFK